ncbi:unnamed protein product [Calicophoron daubneyi]|uniref:Adiponectin receptor protein n=1 Tax=Calicophoron daubneyi TaxID=300641 RepID=A0AAV2THT0_CALDB
MDAETLPRGSVDSKVDRRQASMETNNQQELADAQDSKTDLVEQEEGKFHCADYLGMKDITQLVQAMAQSAEEYARLIWTRRWHVVPFHRLPAWLKDNELLLRGHRPQLYTLRACVRSIFRVRTETGNIWTHLLGCACFVAIAVFFVAQPNNHVQWQEKVVFSCFFSGAVMCMGFSCLLHTLLCHSELVSRIVNKLDYCGIALLTVGSFVPYIYYSFYCVFWAKMFYVILISMLGCGAIVVSMSDKFATPAFRSLRAIVFIALGLSGLIPCIHFICVNGFWPSVNDCSVGWLFLMAILYISGASIYAVRIPERLFPGRFDIWFQSHQILHVFVVAAALVHYHGVVKMANYRLTVGDCQLPAGFLFPKHPFDSVVLLQQLKVA